MFVKEDGSAAGHLQHAAELTARHRGASVKVNHAVSAEQTPPRVVHGHMRECNRLVAAADVTTVTEGQRRIFHARNDQFAFAGGDFALVGHIGVNITERIAECRYCQVFADGESPTVFCAS